MATTFEGRGSAANLGRLHDRIAVADDREALSVSDPFTGGELTTIPAGTAADVERAVEAGREAGEQWARWPARERADVVLTLHDMVLDRQAEVVDVIQRETGKCRLDAFEEVLDVATTARYYGKRAPGLLEPTPRQGAVPLVTDVQERRHPRGVVGVISPWNYPLALSVSDAIPALLAGNPVVLKPAIETSHVALLAAEMLREAGLPEHVFQVVTGRGGETGPPLVDAVDFLTFTGSTETGRTVAERAGRSLVDCSLELGGKNPMVVLDDADIGQAVTGAVQGAFANAGQLCLAPERIYVHESVAGAFTERFVAAAEDLRLGVNDDWETDVGSLISAEHLEKVTAHVADAREKGATVLTGGDPRPDVGPYVYEPTILTDVTDEVALCTEETFGPVVSVYEVGSEAEAVRRANDSDYGLNASVWTTDAARGREVAARIECGTVGVNDPYQASYGSLDAPMGGMHDSGIGRRHGTRGLLKYTEAQTIATQRTGPVVPPDPMPNAWYAKLMTGLLRVLKRLP